jgi:hypothetical protein
VQHLTAGASSYATAEAVNVASLVGQICGFFNPDGVLTTVLTDVLDIGASFVQFAMTHSLLEDLALPFWAIGASLLGVVGVTLFVLFLFGVPLLFGLLREWGLFPLLSALGFGGI